MNAAAWALLQPLGFTKVDLAPAWAPSPPPLIHTSAHTAKRRRGRYLPRAVAELKLFSFETEHEQNTNGGTRMTPRGRRTKRTNRTGVSSNRG